MLERKYLAHFIDASFGGSTVNYVRLGEDLEDYSIELNPDIEQFKNILGESKMRHNGYEASSEVTPYYATIGDALFEKIWEIADERKTGDACKTTVVDVLLNESGTVEGASRENVRVVPQSQGGDTSGVQVPFSIYYDGARTKGTFDMATKTFTPAST